MQYMLWNEKLLNYLYATSISLQLTDQSILWPVSIFIWFVYIKFGCKGGKKKQNGVGNLRFHCFLHTNQSLGVYGWQADRDIPSTASPQQDFRALCWPFLLNSDTKRMYKLGNQRIIKECHYNYQSLKASQQYSRLKFHIIYFIFKSPDICDPLSKYGGGGGLHWAPDAQLKTYCPHWLREKLLGVKCYWSHY